MIVSKEQHFDWLGIIAYAGLHLACLGVFFIGNVGKGILICISMYFLRMIVLGITYHRYLAHRTYKTSRVTQFILAFIASTIGMERGPLWWASTHRTHHRYSDTPDDLHSPQQRGFWYAHLGWIMIHENRQTDYSVVKDWTRYPELVFLDQPVVNNVLLVLHAVVLYWLFGPAGFFWGVCVSGVLVLHMTHWEQSVSHSYGGYRNFDTPDSSRNHWLFGVLSMGEWHNNHHYRPASCRQGVHWWEIDVVYYILKMLSWLGLVWDLRAHRDLEAIPQSAQIVQRS